MDHEIIVVGAGFAGLTAARRLHRAGRDVAVVESRARVGGRTRTDTSHGTWLDLGGQWIGPTQHRIRKMCADYGVRTYPQPTIGDDILLDGGERSRWASIADAFTPAELTDYLTLCGALEDLAATIPVDAPWSAPDAAVLDGQTLASWVSVQPVAPRAARLFDVGVQAVFAAGAIDFSLLHAAHYVASAGGWASLTETEGGAQHERVVGGLQPLAELIAAELGPERVLLGHPVNHIDHSTDQVTVSGTRDTGGGESWSATSRRAIITLPPALVPRMRFRPPLPAARDQLCQHLPAGSVVKFHVLYPRPFWRDDGLSGQVISPDEVVGATFDGSPPDGSVGVITGFLEAAHATWGGHVGLLARRSAVLDVLTRGLGTQGSEPLDYVDLDWSQEEWTRGCYGAHAPPGAWTRWGPSLRPPIGPLHWAGTETATRWTGYIDGAIESGERAADEVLAALGD